MRIGLVLLLGPVLALAQAPPTACNTIQQLDQRLAEQRAELARSRERYTDNHPLIAMLKSRIEQDQGARAAELQRAASQGLTCSAAPPPRPATPSPSQNISQ